MRPRVKTSHIRLDGLILKVSRKKIRNLYLRVANGEVRISAPSFLSDERLVSFVRARLPWIKAKLAENPAPELFENGTPILVWGRSLPLAIHAFAGFCAVKPATDRVHAYFRAEADQERIAGLLLSWRKDVLLEPARKLLDMHQERMGVAGPLELRIRKMRARWGACMPLRRKITLNASLARFSPVCLEFVIVHELSHTLVPNHGSAFVATMDRWLPDWRERKARLEREASLPAR